MQKSEYEDRRVLVQVDAPDVLCANVSVHTSIGDASRAWSTLNTQSEAEDRRD